MSIAVVITTIQSPTPGIRAIADGMSGGDLILIGDRKTPTAFGLDGALALSIDQQTKLPFATAQAVPENSYTRKMIGYLVAMERDHSFIRETDDDNEPYAAFFDSVPDALAIRHAAPTEWVNPYTYFTDRFVWPRGFPLDEVHQALPLGDDSTEILRGPFLLQGLADGDPDVDAVYRLTASNPEPITFHQHAPVLIARDSWAPFNSQVTTWPRELFPLMYLPATCSFRMTDIWRSFIAQRLMREHNAHLVFTAPTVFQDRNTHDLMRDFRDEVEGYLGYRGFTRVLNEVPGLESAHPADGLRIIYDHLIAAGFFTDAERPLLDAWLTDLGSLGMGPA